MLFLTDYYGSYNYGHNYDWTLVWIILLSNFIWIVVSAAIASKKGRSALGWGFIGFVFGLFGVIAISIASDLTEKDALYSSLKASQLQNEKNKEPKSIAKSTNPDKTLRFKIKRIGYFNPDVRALFILYNTSTKEIVFKKDIILEIKHDLEESDVTDIRWLENKIEVDILHSRKKPPRTYTFEY